jgi:predicted RNase H-like nuclease (RuvC/YqgF family)
MTSNKAAQHSQKVYLAGGNQVSQAVKPTKAKITLAQPVDDPITYRRWNELKQELQNTRSDLLRTQEEKHRLCDKLNEAHSKIAALKQICQHHGIEAPV